MKIGDIVKLKDDPKHDWMFRYLEETFQVVDFPAEDSVKLKMDCPFSDWFWIIEKENLELTHEER